MSATPAVVERCAGSVAGAAGAAGAGAAAGDEAVRPGSDGGLAAVAGVAGRPSLACVERAARRLAAAAGQQRDGRGGERAARLAS